ncbi:hypothetical protein L6164_009340 [Bauhinia variegata]|uniref:Uncharacterized protein n=1 Tax=Bauhinia variegata TaxID=167791 RepID=A0ACB9PJS4_BAUVA|nr:hypothetical protein L6164_009340 [Bauhinia variegata]
MAGLQQYNFFPTDLLYPRPQPQASAVSLESASASASGFPLQTTNRADQNQQQQLRGLVMVSPPSAASALVYNQRRQSKFPASAWLTWVEEKEGTDSF